MTFYNWAMVEPDDFGLGAIATLARVDSGARSSRHGPFWKSWAQTVLAHDPRLIPRDARRLDPSDDSATHEFESVRHARIGCSLVLPTERSTPIRAGLVTTHGYEDPPRLAHDARRWRELADLGVAVLLVRVRGYPGSQADVPGMVRDLGDDRRTGAGPAPHMEYRGGGLWITHGLEEPITEGELGCAWSLAAGVADVALATRALRRWLEDRGVRGRVFLHGESFGAGLALLAASGLAATHARPVERLVLELPALGHWSWRLADPALRMLWGTGRWLAEFIAARRDLEPHVAELLQLFDAAIHAGSIRAPALVKLSRRDEVVPAPAAAAVFNALGSAPGEKWRYVTAQGHADGGLADARRHALFARIARMFLDPRREPIDAMAACEAWMLAGPRPGQVDLRPEELTEEEP